MGHGLHVSLTPAPQALHQMWHPPALGPLVLSRLGCSLLLLDLNTAPRPLSGWRGKSSNRKNFFKAWQKLLCLLSHVPPPASTCPVQGRVAHRREKKHMNLRKKVSDLHFPKTECFQVTEQEDASQKTLRTSFLKWQRAPNTQLFSFWLAEWPLVSTWGGFGAAILWDLKP